MMTAIPFFTTYTVDNFMDEWDVTPPLCAEPMEIIIEGKHYHSNQYDMQYHDKESGRSFSISVFADKKTDEILAVSPIVYILGTKEECSLHETPFFRMLETIKSK